MLAPTSPLIDVHIKSEVDIRQIEGLPQAIQALAAYADGDTGFEDAYPLTTPALTTSMASWRH
jgi:hypothetical protein